MDFRLQGAWAGLDFECEALVMRITNISSNLDKENGI